MDIKKQAMIMEAKKYCIRALKYRIDGIPNDGSSKEELRITYEALLKT